MHFSNFQASLNHRANACPIFLTLLVTTNARMQTYESGHGDAGLGDALDPELEAVDEGLAVVAVHRAVLSFNERRGQFFYLLGSGGKLRPTRVILAPEVYTVPKGSYWPLRFIQSSKGHICH
jgi:hypothetical protein